jgi:6-phosphogluconolactonase (cycloisomerase 2 family)
MLKQMRWFVWGTILMVFFPLGLAAQVYVYTNNDLTTANSISAYSVDTNGSQSEISGSPFVTDGMGNGGGLYSANRIIIVNDFLYASNSHSNAISAFTISGTGVLIPVGGSPFSTGSFDDTIHSGISLAATPDGMYLYAGSTGLAGQITIFSIYATGALTIVDKSPIAADGPMSSLKISPDGNYLVAAIFGSSELSIYAIRKNGTLREIHGSPYVLSSGAATSVDFNCASNLLYAGGPTGNIYAFNFSSGKLSPVAGSPFATGVVSNQIVALSADDATLFSSNQGGNTVTAFAVGVNGDLTLPGTSANAAGSSTTATSPGGLAVSGDSLYPFLFSADATSDMNGHAGFSIFNLAGSPPISFVSLNSTGQTSGLASLAVYPAKACVAPAGKVH